jgi:cation transport regulator ChaC
MAEMKHTVGILAYGSLIDDPGEEIANATIRTTMNVLTPFSIEFARRSRSRGGAPTLIPVVQGGRPVLGRVFVLDVPEDEAANRLWRREVRKVGSAQAYEVPRKIGTDTVVVRRLENFADVKVVLYTEIAANIEPLTAKSLAGLAMESMDKSDPGMDGISYLIAAKKNGITTALSADYEAEILRQSGCSGLEEALARFAKASKGGSV